MEEKLSELSDADTYYLLTTIATMAMARTQEDFLFIKAATLQLLEVSDLIILLLALIIYFTEIIS